MKYTKDIFINMANKVHNFKYDYSLVKYINSKFSVKIICPIHGEFEQTPHHHLKHGCRLCGHNQSKYKISESNKNRLNTTYDFINRSNVIHNFKYDYSSSIYKGANKKVKIICPVHGEFEQLAKNHLKGCGCYRCSRNIKRFGIDRLKLDFVDKAKAKHNNKYDYSKVKYINHYTPVVIICPFHGEFKQKPTIHLNSHGCQKCAKEIAIGKNSLNSNILVEKFKTVHGDLYDYSKVKYNGYYDKIEIVCKKHGSFFQTPSNHLINNCPKCYIESRTLSTEEFIKKAKSVHGELYDYSKVIYKNYDTKVIIICSLHGEFEQLPKCHLKSIGCPFCSISASKSQKEIYDYILSLGLNAKFNDKFILSPYEIDVLCGKLGIELHGLYWHSYNKLERHDEKYKHYYKVNLANKKNIDLVQIFENEWLYKNDIVKSVLHTKLGCNKTVYARNCFLKEVDNNCFNNFMECNHIQGRLNSMECFGLYHDSDLVCCIGFRKHCKYDYEITRLASKKYVSVIGGASKLFKYFLNKFNPNTILSFSDRRYFSGKVYGNLGFNLVGITNPNYFYIKNNNLYSRMIFQKHELSSKLDNYDSSMSESQNMFSNGYRRIWDAGHYKFLYSKI